MTVWDRRLMSPGRAIELAGEWPLRVRQVGGRKERRPVAFCGYCGSSVLDLEAFRLTPESLLAAALRHAVESHELPLSGAAAEEDDDGRGRPDQGARAAAPGGAARAHEPGADPVRRMAEAPARRRAPSGA